MSQSSQNYDLEERTSHFGEAVMKFCRKITKDAITKSLIGQLIRSSTSIGANYMEANGASSNVILAPNQVEGKLPQGSRQTTSLFFWIPNQVENDNTEQ